MATLLFQQLESHAARQPAQIAIEEHRESGDTRTITWRDYRNAIAAFAGTLRSNIEPGTTVLLVATNRIE